MTQSRLDLPQSAPKQFARVTPDMPSPRVKCSILAVDDEPAILSLLVQQLGHDFDVVTVANATDALKVLAQRTVDIVLSDLNLPDSTGIQLLDRVYRTAPRTARVLISGTASIQDAVDAVNRGHVHRLILKPWRGEDLLTHMKDVARGLFLERSHERLLEELRTLNQDLERRVQERTQELRQMNQILEKMALTDQMTGLPNRRSIELIARQELLRRSRTPTPIAFGLIDADRFKKINSKYLHTGGDQALVYLARTFQQTIRGTDAVGRVGGEEFLVVAPDTDVIGAETLAERIRAAAEQLVVPYKTNVIPVTVSCGFAVADSATAVQYDRLRELAAEALLEAKNRGRNRCVVKVLTEESVASSS
jgi:diguanylate cyclase